MIRQVALACILLVSPACHPKAIATFDTRTDPDFGDATPALQAFLEQRAGVPAGPQHFCVAGLPPTTPDGGSKRAWVHWKEGDLLILWEGGDTIASSRRKLNLKTDVVATEADIQGSTYLVTKAWVDGIVSACEAAGAKYTLEKKLNG